MFSHDVYERMHLIASLFGCECVYSWLGAHVQCRVPVLCLWLCPVSPCLHVAIMSQLHTNGSNGDSMILLFFLSKVIQGCNL